MERAGGRLAEVDRRASTLATSVRRLRESHGLSLQQLAARAGLAKTTLFKIESGRGNPTLETMLTLGEFFSVSIAELLGGDATPAIEVVRAGSEGVDISGTAVTAALVRSMMVGATLVEVIDVAIHPGLWETAVSHGAGAREHVLVRRGRAIVGPIEHEVELGAGDYATYFGDRPHRWGNPGKQDALLWVIHTFPRGTNGSGSWRAGAAQAQRPLRARVAP